MNALIGSLYELKSCKGEWWDVANEFLIICNFADTVPLLSLTCLRLLLTPTGTLEFLFYIYLFACVYTCL